MRGQTYMTSPSTWDAAGTRNFKARTWSLEVIVEHSSDGCYSVSLTRFKHPAQLSVSEKFLSFHRHMYFELLQSIRLGQQSSRNMPAPGIVYPHRPGRSPGNDGV